MSEKKIDEVDDLAACTLDESSDLTSSNNNNREEQHDDDA
jgi:hypothetical protein